jgi:hypothetical protein
MVNLIKQEDVMLSETERLNAYRQMQLSIRNSEHYPNFPADYNDAGSSIGISSVLRMSF